MINKHIIVGHLGRDAEVRRSQGGKPIASFSVATTDRWRDKATGERREHTTWHRVVVFNETLAEIAGKYLKKGARVYVEGASKNREYTDKDGIQRYVTELILSGFNCQLHMLDRSEGGGAVPPAEPSDYGDVPGAAPDRPHEQTGEPASGKRDLNDDIPF